MQSDVFVFIGPPGSGKGSLSQLCREKFGWEQLSTGDLCRRHIAEQTDIGKAIDLAIKSGKLVSDSLIAAMVADWFSTNTSSAAAVILDGYPRTIAQAEALNELLTQMPSAPRLHIVRFVVSDEQVVKRLSSRFICKNKECQRAYSAIPGSSLAPEKEGICDACGTELVRRKDDEPEAIKERLLVFHKHEQGLIDFYIHRGQPVQELDGGSPLPEVFEYFEQLAGRGQ